MPMLTRRLIGTKTASNALECGLAVVLAAVVLIVSVVGLDPMQPIDYPHHPKFHWQGDRIS